MAFLFQLTPRSDGACRHIAAALYEIEAFEKKSVTDGPSQWAKKARLQDETTRIQDLPICKAKSI